MTRLETIFVDEVSENIDAIDHVLLSIDGRSPERGQIDTAFRCAHSVKGGAAAIGVADLAELMHGMESVFARWRGGVLVPDRPMIGLLLEATDAARHMLLRARHEEEPAHRPPASDLLGRLRQIASADLPAASARRRNLQVRAGPLDRPQQGEALIGLFRDIAGLGHVAALSPTDADTLVFDLQTDATDGELRDLMGMHIARERIVITPNDKDHDFRPPQRVTEIATVPQLPLRVDAADVVRLARMAEHIAATGNKLQALAWTRRRGQIDALRAELVLLQTHAEELGQLTQALRRAPLSKVFDRIPRLLRELSISLGKSFTLEVAGETMVLDRAVVQGLVDPLIHLVRNACDHGIEAPDERSAAGKRVPGAIRLNAYARDGWAYVEVHDDGRGLRRPDLLHAARTSGLDVSDDMADEAVWQLVFVPGLSTMKDVTQTSGRGVGLDVVKRKVVALGGAVTIASTPGHGTCFAVRLPLGADVIEGRSAEV